MKEKKQTSVVDFDYGVRGAPYYYLLRDEDLAEKFVASVAEQYNLLKGVDHIVPPGGPKHRLGERIMTVFNDEIRPSLESSKS